MKVVQEHKNFEVGHDQSSKTRGIATVTLDHGTLVDTQGLTDTKGDLYDILNSIILEKAFHAAEKVKIVFMVKQSSLFEGKGKVLRDLAV